MRDRHYIIDAYTWLATCCNEIQFRYTCRKCSKDMGCYYCDFDYHKEHDCEEN